MSYPACIVAWKVEREADDRIIVRFKGADRPGHEAGRMQY